MNQSRNGFTLLEILVVITILGILMSIFGVNYAENIRRQQFNEAATTVYAELNRARSTSQRTSTPQAVTWTATTLSAGAGRSIMLPNGARFVTTPEAGLTYTAPYGELAQPGGTSGGYRLELLDRTGRYRTAVDAVGVTGKVIRRQVVKASEAIN